MHPEAPPVRFDLCKKIGGWLSGTLVHFQRAHFVGEVVGDSKNPATHPMSSGARLHFGGYPLPVGIEDCVGAVLRVFCQRTP
jgi:hypothetical protein